MITDGVVVVVVAVIVDVIPGNCIPDEAIMAPEMLVLANELLVVCRGTGAVFSCSCCCNCCCCPQWTTVMEVVPELAIV